MTKTWFAAALLACSWLFGLPYYRPESWLAWSAIVACGTILLAGTPLRMPTPKQSGAALAMLLPVIWLTPWPYRAVPLAMALGLALHLAPISRCWPGRLGRGAVAAGLVLLVQSVSMESYASLTARSHDLPAPLPSLLGMIARLLGADVAVDGSTLALGSLREVHRLGATWDLLVDPPTLAFFLGAALLLGLASWDRWPAGQRWTRWGRGVGPLAAIVLAWLPLRAGLLVALFLHRAVRVDLGSPLNLMDQFFSPWLNLGLLAVPVLAAGRLVRVPAQEAAPGGETGTSQDAAQSSLVLAAGLVFAAAALLAFGFFWEPVGQRKEGRVMVVERHSTWEPTAPAYDTARFGETASYTYAAIYDYCSRFYEMSRLEESESITTERLSACDVLVIKIPTARYSRDETAAVAKFVERGGSLLLIGEHTDFEKSTTYLNEIAEPFGFGFRKDLLFCVGDPYVQWYEPETRPHPIVQHVPRMTFAVSCSIDPGWSLGTAVVRGTGLWNLPPQYSTSNFFPEAEQRADMRFGAFVQMWATRYGRGRVLAWTDSTIPSNFCTFEPGKAEFMLGMLEWLNRRSIFDSFWARVLVQGTMAAAGLVLICGGIGLARRRGLSPLLLVAAALLGWAVCSAGVAAWHRSAMPTPEPVRPMVRVAIDRTVSAVPLSRNGFTQDTGRGYGLLEQWIPRLGYFTARRTGIEAFSSDALVVICPTRSVSEEFRQRLVSYVSEGGKLLVIDSPDSAGSTANSLLWPFGLAATHAASRPGKLATAEAWPGIAVQGACEISGGTPLLWVEGMPVAARTAFGKGAVLAIGFGSVMNDAGLGQTYMTEANPEMLLRSDLLFTLVRALVEDKPVVAPPPRKAEPPAPAAKPAAKPR